MTSFLALTGSFSVKPSSTLGGSPNEFCFGKALVESQQQNEILSIVVETGKLIKDKSSPALQQGVKICQRVEVAFI